MGWLSGVPCIAKLMNANNPKAPLGSGNGLGPKATSHRQNHWWRIQLAPLEGSEFIQAWGNQFHQNHNRGVRMSAMPSQITRASIVFLTFSWGADERKHQSYASLAPVRGIHRWGESTCEGNPSAWPVADLDILQTRFNSEIPAEKMTLALMTENKCGYQMHISVTSLLWQHDPMWQCLCSVQSLCV